MHTMIGILYVVLLLLVHLIASLDFAEIPDHMA
jgi:hypothetical protein